MVSAAIKYVIGEICINAFFDRVFENFNTELVTDIPRVGDFYSRISHKYEEETFYDCYVENIEQVLDKDGVATGEHMIFIKFKTINTDDDFFDGGDVDTLSDEELAEYEREEAAYTETLTPEELEAYLSLEDDDVDDMSEADLIGTEDPKIVGVNSEFYNFYR